VPQAPQLAGSVLMFTQALLHTAVPAGVSRGPHVPVARPVFAIVHPWHDSPHVLEQQTPSEEQELLAHWFAAVHAVPVAFLATHAVPEQKLPVAQSVSAAHVVLHAIVPHANGAQLVVTGVGQTPLPLQLVAAVATPPVQLAATHTLVAGCSWQDAFAAHNPVLPHTGPVVQRASAVPTLAFAHIPSGCPVFAYRRGAVSPLST